MSKDAAAVRDDTARQIKERKRKAYKDAKRKPRKDAKRKPRESDSRTAVDRDVYAPETAFNNLSASVHRVSAHAAGSLRLSIKLRIALAHVLLLGRKVFSAALLIIIAVAWSHWGMYQARYNEGLTAIETMDLDANDPVYSPAPGVEAAWEGYEAQEPSDDESSDGDSGWHMSDLYSRRENTRRLSLPNGWGVEWRTVDNDPERPERPDIFVIRASGGYMIRLDIRESTVILLWCGFALAVYWVVMTLAILREGQGVSARLLAPITHISNTAEQLSEQNLSMRINVAGTQNELRNLAMMVNGMLDRIESAYNRQKQFVSDASHELRTPIAVVQGYADLLARWGKDAPDVRDESIQAIQNETRSMKELVENLLYLARHDKGTLKLNPEPFSAVELVQETVRETALIASDHHIESGGLEDCTLIADRSAIKQALRIFVDNAVKYTPAGGYVSLSCWVENRQCAITVRDTGAGISKQDLPRIFDRFYRADTARNIQAGGHGLGLSIARIIVSSHGGKLHVKSKPGIGSAFTIFLPVMRPPM
ncbi:MAG: HAMP domain-containing histidine kinase [Oscillospiraceae bacterium]|jgi:signal transduction histidine kinase|nr:HAMP domain-containing histidine kinase [Oscillospiraceae bacterium]